MMKKTLCGTEDASLDITTWIWGVCKGSMGIVGVGLEEIAISVGLLNILLPMQSRSFHSLPFLDQQITIAGCQL
jgi:hypothetical protein